MTFWEYMDRRGQRIAKSPAGQWGDPRVAVTCALIALFAYAYINRPDNGQMNGALIAAFAAAYGYWIGASKGAATLNENLGKSLDLAQTAQNAVPTLADPSTITDGDTVTIKKDDQ